VLLVVEPLQPVLPLPALLPDPTSFACCCLLVACLFHVLPALPLHTASRYLTKAQLFSNAGADRTMPVVQAVDSRDAVPPTLKFAGRPPSSRKPKHKMYDGLLFWDFVSEAIAWNMSPFLLNREVKVPLFATGKRTRKARSEDDLVYQTRRVCDVLAELTEEQLEFNGQLTVGGSRLDIGGCWGLQVITALEGKKVGFIPPGASLAAFAQAFEANEGDTYVPGEQVIHQQQEAAAAALEQLNHYLHSINPTAVTYGAIFTYFDFWFVRRDPESNMLAVSAALQFDSESPTLLRALAYLCHKSMESAQQHPYLTLPADPAGGDAGSGASADKDSEAKHGGAGGEHGKDPSNKDDGSDAQGRSTEKRVKTSHLHVYPSLGVGRTGPVALVASRSGLSALKFVSLDSDIVGELRHEVSMYHELQVVQGIAIPQLFHAGVLFGGGFFGMYLEVVGPNLAELLAHNMLHAEDLQKLRDNCLRSLEAVHAQGILHNDIRLENVCLAAERVRIVDFGFARHCQDPVLFQRECKRMQQLF
jgi:hypothetical protein